MADDTGNNEPQDDDDDDGAKPDRVLTPDEIAALNSDPGKKALADERRARKVAERTANELAAKVKEFEEKGLSEQEKLARTAQDAESRATRAEAQLTRYQVAQEKGLTAAQAKYLQGSDRKELEARADEILTDFPVQKGNGFVPLFDQGVRGNGAGSGTDMNAIIRRQAGYS